MSQKTAASWAARLPVSPAVLWTGIALGVFLAVEAVVHGVVLPLSLGLLADAVLTFLLIVAVAVVLAELTRRHHRTVLRHGGRLSAAGARRARRHGGTVLGWLAARPAPLGEPGAPAPDVPQAPRRARRPRGACGNRRQPGRCGAHVLVRARGPAVRLARG